MLIIHNTETDAYFNLASEEYMMERTDCDVFMLWRNESAVIIGKNQNAWAEVNTTFTEEHRIKVVRRLTGGGAVFHDLGNINFTFITNAEDEAAASGTSPACGELAFGRFILPITEALSGLGVQAAADGRNDIVAGGYKISGNAQCVYHTTDGRKRRMHHGTLLFSADMSRLAGALNVSKAKMESKGIQSVRARVTNICSLEGYHGPTSAEGFLAALDAFAESTFGSPSRDFNTEERAGINALRENKYSRWDWNFGKSPAYSVTNEKRFPYGTVTVMFTANQGVIEQIRITGDYFGTEDVSVLESQLVGIKIAREPLEAALSGCCRYIAGSSPADLLELII